MHQWVLDTQKALEPIANADNARQMSAYMREKFSFFGIQSADRRDAVKSLFNATALPAIDDLPIVTEQLWDMPEREYQMVAIDLLIRLKKKIPVSMASQVERCIVTKSWWDTVDMLATHIAGALYLRFPEPLYAYLERWRYSENLWLRRTTLLYQLKFKHDTDHQRLFDLIRYNLDDSDFFIQKAIGWSLREYSKTAPDRVIEFLASHSIQGLARREALKWLNKHRS